MFLNIFDNSRYFPASNSRLMESRWGGLLSKIDFNNRGHGSSSFPGFSFTFQFKIFIQFTQHYFLTRFAF